MHGLLTKVVGGSPPALEHPVDIGREQLLTACVHGAGHTQVPNRLPGIRLRHDGPAGAFEQKDTVSI